MKPIRNVVFDMGQVMRYFTPQLYIQRQGVAEADRPLLLREIFQKVEWIQMDRGTLNVEQGAEIICSRLPEHLRSDARAIIQGWWKAPMQPVPGMAELMGEIKEMNYGVYMLSNANEHLHIYVDDIPGSEYLDGKIVSADWGMLKPERGIFDKLTELFGLDLEECVFIDDSPVNVEGSLRAGLHGIVFHDDIQELREELRRLGIPVRLDS